MDMGDGSSFIDEITHSDLFGHEADGASGFEWADDFISSVEGEEKTLETTAVNQSVQQTVQYGHSSSGGHMSGQSSAVNVQMVQSSTSTQQQTHVQQNIQPIQQPAAQIIPNLSNFTQGGNQLIQGVNGQIFLKQLPNGQFQLATAQPQIQQIQHPQQSSSPIPIQPHPQGSLVQNQSPIPISSPHVGASSSSPNVSRSHTPIQQSRQFQNVNFLQVQGSQSQPQIVRNLPITSQISNNFQAQQIIQSQGQHVISNQGQLLQSQGQPQVPNPGQNYVNTQNTVIQNPNVVNVNVAHVLCSNQFQGQQGQSIQGTLIQTADGKHIIIPSSQLPSSNQIQIQNVPQMAIQQQFVPTSSSTGTGTTPLVQGGQVLENNAATLGGLGYIRIATPSTSNQEVKVQQQPQTHFLGVNSQGQQILIQRTPTPNQNTGIVLRQVTPQNVLQLPQTQQTQSSGQVIPQTSQATQQILLPQVQRIPVVTGHQGQPQVKLVTPGNLQTGNIPMTINIGGQNVILPSNLQQLIQQTQSQSSQIQKQPSSNETVLQNRALSSTVTSSIGSNRVISSSQASQPLTITTMVNNQTPGVGQVQSLNSQVPTFLLPAVNASTASMTPVTTTVSQTKQAVSQVSISNSPKMYQTISSVASNVSSTASTQKPFLSAVTNAPKLPMTTIHLSPQAEQQITSLQNEIRKLQSLKDPTDHQKQQLLQFRELQKRILIKAQIGQQQAQSQPLVTQATGIQNASNLSNIIIGQPAVTKQQSGHVTLHQQSSTQSQALSNALQSPGAGGVQPQQITGQQVQTLVSSDNSFTSTCPTKSVQSQNGSIMSVSPTGTKTSQPVIISQVQTKTSTIPTQSGSIIVQGQQGPVVLQSHQKGSVVIQGQPGSLVVQGQPGSLRMQVQTTTSSAPSASATSVNTTTTPVKVMSIGGLQGNLAVGNTPTTAGQVAVPTQIKIANHILTLNLTPEQKDKVQGYLAKMPPEQQQQQMALFLKLQHQQKLNAQVQAQIQQQKKLQAQQNLASNIQSQLPLTVQPQLVPTSTGSSIINVEQPSTSPSKPNIVHRVSVAAIPKHQLIHQQMGKDQANAIQTDTKTPFRNQRDMYRRLLRYHVFQTKNPPNHLVKKDDEMFEDLSEGLVRKKNWMFEKYRSLILEESMREKQTAEIMMIQKLLNEDLKETLEEDKRVTKRNPDVFEPMPRKYLKLEPDDTPDVKFDPSSIQVKQENVPSPAIPTNVKKENYDSDGSRPSTPKLKLVIKSDGQSYSSLITEEDSEQTSALNSGEINKDNFMNGINIKQEQIEIDDNPNDVPFNDARKPFDSYSQDNKEDSFYCPPSNISDDLNNTADSSSDVTVVSDDEKMSDAIVIDDDDDEMEDISKGDNRTESNSQKPLKVEPVVEHEDISSDFTDYFSKSYRSGSSEMHVPYYSQTSQSQDHTNVLSRFSSSDQISNELYSQNSDAQSTQNSDAQSTQTIPYSEDGNSVKDEDISNDIDYNKSTSSFAQYEPISSPEGDQEESFSNYLNYSSSFNMGGIRDQGLNFGLSDTAMETNHMTDDVIESPPWQETNEEDDTENADRIKAEMESAINSILSLN